MKPIYYDKPLLMIDVLLITGENKFINELCMFAMRMRTTADLNIAFNVFDIVFWPLVQPSAFPVCNNCKNLLLLTRCLIRHADPAPSPSSNLS